MLCCSLVLRPSDSLLSSSRATHRASLRAERLRAFWQLGRLLKSLVTSTVRSVVDLALLVGLPFAYLAATYLALDLPARWIGRRDAYGRWGLLLFAGAVAICWVGVLRAKRDAPPIAPVRPRFAKVMFGLSWIAAILCTIGDLAS
jgi:hypothetical protein